MPSGDATNEPCTDNVRKRIRFADATPTSTAPVFSTTPGQSPSAAAKTCSNAAVVSLHPLLRPHILAHAERFILAFSTWFYKNEKHKKMKDDADFIPSPAKIGLTLEPFDDVRKSEEYNALAEQLASTISKCQLELRDIILTCTEMNVKALQKNIHKSFAIALPAIAEGFLALDNVKNYSKHHVVADLLDRHQDEIFGHLNISRTDFIILYKTVHELTTLPSSATIPTPTNPPQALPPQQNQVNAIATSTATATAPAAAAAAALPATPAINLTYNGSVVAVRPDQRPPTHTNSVDSIVVNLEGEGFQFIRSPYNGIPGVFVNTQPPATPTTANTATAATVTPTTTNQTTAAIQNITHPSHDTLGIEGLNEPDGLNPLFDYGINENNTADEAMEDAAPSDNNPPATDIIVGAKATIINQVRNVVSRAFLASITSFVNQVQINEQNARIKKATAKLKLEYTADNTAAVLQNEGSVDPTILKGLINKEAKKRTSDLDKRIQSLESKLELEKKKSTTTTNNRRAANNSNTTNNSKNGHRGAPKGAASKNKSSNNKKNSNSQSSSRRKANAPAKDSDDGSTASNKPRFSSKSKKKNNSSKTTRSNSSGRSNKK